MQRQFRHRGIEAALPAQPVDGLEASGGDQPGARIVRHAVPRPLRGGGDEGLVQRFLGTVEIAEQADERCQDTLPLGPVDGLDIGTRAIGGPSAHGASGRRSRMLDRAHLDRAEGRHRDASGDVDGIVEVARLDDDVAGKVLLGFGERPVGDGDVAAAHAHRDGVLSASCRAFDET